MPWKERSVVEERMRFVLRLMDGESMASPCREFGISRVTGYKIYERYKECGLEGRKAKGEPGEAYYYVVVMSMAGVSFSCGDGGLLVGLLHGCF